MSVKSSARRVLGFRKKGKLEEVGRGAVKKEVKEGREKDTKRTKEESQERTCGDHSKRSSCPCEKSELERVVFQAVEGLERSSLFVSFLFVRKAKGRKA